MFGWIRRLMGRGSQAQPAADATDHHAEGERRLTEGEWWNEPAGPPPPTVGEILGDEPRLRVRLPAPPSLPPGLLPTGNEEYRRQRIADALEKDAAAKYMRGAPGR